MSVTLTDHAHVAAPLLDALLARVAQEVGHALQHLLAMLAETNHAAPALQVQKAGMKLKYRRWVLNSWQTA